MKLGEARSPCLFKLLYAKRIRETIKVLRTQVGEIIEDEEAILYEVYNHCRNLYAKDSLVESFQSLRDEVLALLDMQFSEEDNIELKVVLEDDKIQRVVFGFPKEKSPGGDGVTYDLLQEMWDLVGEGCIAMVKEFWKDGLLSTNTINGIVKMVLKCVDLLDSLDYWRNLTMLATTYKIISKILVERIKPLVHGLVNGQ